MNFLKNGINGREALLIDPAKARDFAAREQSFGMMDMIAEMFGKSPDAYVLSDGTAVIPVYGPIGKNLSPMDKMLGGVDVNELMDEFKEYEADMTVKRIVFDFDSPGGTVTGIPELAKRIRNCAKPTMAYTASEMDSAAYWIGSACDRVVSSGSAYVGSVGVYMVITDVSAAYMEEGYRQVVVKSGKYKAAGLEGTSLTDDQLANLQSGVDYIHSQFKDSVRLKRSLVPDDAMEGQSFLGSQAAGVSLITGLADTLDDAIASWE